MLRLNDLPVVYMHINIYTNIYSYIACVSRILPIGERASLVILGTVVCAPVYSVCCSMLQNEGEGPKGFSVIHPSP